MFRIMVQAFGLPRRGSGGSTSPGPAGSGTLARMSCDPEDEDHTTFFRLEGSHTAEGGEPVVSRAAFQLHGHAIVNSAQDGHPGFVPDEYLNAISAETTIAAAELCAAEMWRRVDGGYEVLDREMVEMAVNQFRKMDADREFCQATGGHEPMDEDPDLCRKCGAWRPTATDWPE
jgi:hypothetical protein